MKIRETLLAQQQQSKVVATRIAHYACTSEDTFRELMDCFTSGEYRLAQRASYCVGIACDERPELIEPYIGTLVAYLRRTDVHDAVIRDCVRTLQHVEIPEEFHGEVIDACFGFLHDRQAPIAVRTFSLTVLYNLGKIYPEINPELKFLIETSIEFETPAFISRGRKILALI
jgi:hypothetical protein